jgi:hypothetical protein
MNPLFLQPANFWVVEAAGSQEEGLLQVQGFGQVRPVPGASGAFELASVYVLVRAFVRPYMRACAWRGDVCGSPIFLLS